MKYTKNELISCIYECMDSSLTASWEYLELKLNIDGNNLNSEFSFKEKNSDELKKYTPQNYVAPINSAFSLHSMKLEEGEIGDTITVKIYCDGKYKIFIN